MYTQVLIYTHLHSCTAVTLIYDSKLEPVPCSDADESLRDESLQSLAVSTVRQSRE